VFWTFNTSREVHEFYNEYRKSRVDKTVWIKDLVVGHGGYKGIPFSLIYFVYEYPIDKPG